MLGVVRVWSQRSRLRGKGGERNRIQCKCVESEKGKSSCIEQFNDSSILMIKVCVCVCVGEKVCVMQTVCSALYSSSLSSCLKGFCGLFGSFFFSDVC